MWEMVVLLALGAGGVWVWSGITARERAVVAARRACERHGQQLLDETVAQISVQMLRNSVSGSLLPKRTYRFEFTADGEVRHSGELAIYGGRVVDLHLALEEFTLYDGDVVAEQDVTAIAGQLKHNGPHNHE